MSVRLPRRQCHTLALSSPPKGRLSRSDRLPQAPQLLLQQFQAPLPLPSNVGRLDINLNLLSMGHPSALLCHRYLKLIRLNRHNTLINLNDLAFWATSFARL